MNEIRRKNKERLDKLRELDKHIITWEEINDYVDYISDIILKKGYSGIYGIPRGGIILAALISYKTNLPMFLSPFKNCIVIDDDIGTGITLNAFNDKYDTSVMFCNKDNNTKCDYIYKRYDDSKYYVFPWNVEEKS